MYSQALVSHTSLRSSALEVGYSRSTSQGNALKRSDGRNAGLGWLRGLSMKMCTLPGFGVSLFCILST